MNNSLRVLIVEDVDDDAARMLRELRADGFEPAAARVESAEAMSAALARESWDAVLSEDVVAGFSAPDALRLLQKNGPDIPFIIVSGRMDREAAAAAIRGGAHGCVPKCRLWRLPAVVRRELTQARTRRTSAAAEEIRFRVRGSGLRNTKNADFERRFHG